MAALGILQATDDPNMKLVGLPLSINGVRPPLRTTVPELGADNEKISGNDTEEI